MHTNLSHTVSVSTGMRQLDLKTVCLDEYSTTEQTWPVWYFSSFNLQSKKSFYSLCLQHFKTQQTTTQTSHIIT